MKQLQKVMNEIGISIKNNTVLEVACGCAEFSIEASKYAKEVFCIDLDNTRLLDEAGSISNIKFSIMNASNMSFENNSFDTVVIYNAIGHLDNIFSELIDECIRVLKENGTLYIISSWKIDKLAIEEKLVKILNEKQTKFNIFEKNGIMYLSV